MTSAESQGSASEIISELELPYRMPVPDWLSTRKNVPDGERDRDVLQVIPADLNYHYDDRLSGLVFAQNFNPQSIFQGNTNVVRWNGKKFYPNGSQIPEGGSRQVTPRVYANLKVVTSLEDVYEALGLSLRASGRYLAFRGSLSTSLERSMQVTSKSISLILYVEATFGKEHLDAIRSDVKLTPEAAALAKADPQKFRDTYGTKYVTAQIPGYRLAAFYQFTGVSREERSTIYAAASASYGKKVSGKATFSSIAERYKTSGQLTFDTLSTKGAPKAAVKALNSPKKFDLGYLRDVIDSVLDQQTPSNELYPIAFQGASIFPLVGEPDPFIKLEQAQDGALAALFPERMNAEAQEGALDTVLKNAKIYEWEEGRLEEYRNILERIVAWREALQEAMKSTVHAKALDDVPSSAEIKELVRRGLALEWEMPPFLSPIESFRNHSWIEEGLHWDKPELVLRGPMNLTYGEIALVNMTNPPSPVRGPIVVTDALNDHSRVAVAYKLIHDSYPDKDVLRYYLRHINHWRVTLRYERPDGSEGEIVQIFQRRRPGY